MSEATELIRAERLRRIYRRRLISLILRTAAFIGIIVYLFTGVFGFAVIESNDMYPAMRSGDLVMFYRKADLITTDVIVYDDAGSGYHAGRIEACRGSLVGVTAEGQITINGNIQPVQERLGIYSKTMARDAGVKVRYPFTVDEGTYFVLGDDRENAVDSRDVGAIDEENILGKVFIIVRRRAI